MLLHTGITGRAMTKKTLYINALIVVNSFTKIFSIRARHLVSDLRNTSLLSIVPIAGQKWKRRCMNENTRTSRSRYRDCKIRYARTYAYTMYVHANEKYCNALNEFNDVKSKYSIKD